MTRRTFAATSAAAASAFAADPPKIRAAMIGSGHGHAHSKLLVMSAMFDFVGVHRPDPSDPALGPGFAKAHWIDEHTALDDPSIQLIACEFADADANLAYAEKAVARGKFVHLDKPPGSSLRRFRKLLADAAAKKLVVQMGYQWRYHRAMREAMHLAQSGALGKVHRFRASIDKPILADERQHLAKYKGGMMFSEGCHLIDRATALLGKPVKVHGIIRHHGTLDDQLADNNLVVLEYPNALAEISLAGFDPNGNEHRYLEIIGSQGSAKVQPFAKYRMFVELKGKAPAEVPFGDPPDPPAYAPDFAEMAAVIRHGAKPTYSAAHDLMTHEVLLEACGMLVEPGEKNP